MGVSSRCYMSWMLVLLPRPAGSRTGVAQLSATGAHACDPSMEEGGLPMERRKVGCTCTWLAQEAVGSQGWPSAAGVDVLGSHKHTSVHRSSMGSAMNSPSVT